MQLSIIYTNKQAFYFKGGKYFILGKKIAPLSAIL
jgi:hypothetical protein